jgi:hypothetical protein
MTTKLDVINQALAYLGNPVINTLNIADPVVNAMSQIYDAEKLNLLSFHPWRFATKWATLQQSVTGPTYPKWGFSYDLPGDYITAYNTYFWCDYEIVGQKVFTNQNPPWLWGYIHDASEQLYPGYFTLALSHQIAAKSATLLTENPEIAKYWQEQATIQNMRAQNRDASAVTSVAIVDNPLLATHYYRGF